MVHSSTDKKSLHFLRILMITERHLMEGKPFFQFVCACLIDSSRFFCMSH